MPERMTRWGVGPRFTLYSFLYAAPATVMAVVVPAWGRIEVVSGPVLIGIGLTLIVVGLPLWIGGVVAAMRAYGADRLCTDGAFGLCRHPVYASWTILLLPGIALLIGSWILLTIPVVMAVILRWLVREEETYLAERFGGEYDAYRKRVPAVLPLGWLKE